MVLCESSRCLDTHYCVLLCLSHRLVLCQNNVGQGLHNVRDHKAETLSFLFVYSIISFGRRTVKYFRDKMAESDGISLFQIKILFWRNRGSERMTHNALHQGLEDGDSQTVVFLPPKTMPRHFHHQKVLCDNANIYICIALKKINTPVVNRSSSLN